MVSRDESVAVFRDLVQLTKPRITFMVVVSTSVGMLLASRSLLPLELWVLALTGTALVSAGALALNQVLERVPDARMDRTANRPIPAGRLSARAGSFFGILLSLTGLIQLALAVNILTAVLGFLTTLSYLFVYTPLKKITSLSTIAGAFPGAVPPMMGWAAVRGVLEPPAWALFAILFLWQLPHFLAIAWLFRDDYARAGFPLLSVGDLGGRRTARSALLWCSALLPVSLLPNFLGVAGTIYAVGALLFGAIFLASCSVFAFRRDRAGARLMLLASVVYQPLILTALAADRVLS